MQWLKKYRPILSSLLLIVGLYLITAWIVRTKRAPGSMTVIEAQAMDMTAMVTPKGVMPVATEKVQRQTFAPMVTYTGTVVAYNDAEIVARVEGRVIKMPVYPGDRVRPGQLLVELDSLERTAQLREAQAGAEAARYEWEAIQREIRQMQAEVEEAQRKRDSAQAMVQRAFNELEAARQELETARAELEEMKAEVESAQVNQIYWRAEAERAENLFKKGAIAKEELQRTQAEAAQAEVEVHHAQVRVQKAEVGIKQAQAMVAAAEAQHTQARHEAEAMQAGVSRARAALSATQAKLLRALAMQQQAQASEQAAQVVRGYTRITADIPGVVTERLVTPGTLVMPGTVLLKLKQDDRLRLQARVAVEDAAQIREGALVIARTLNKAAGSRQQTAEIRARVTSIFSAADPESRTVTVEALIPNHSRDAETRGQGDHPPTHQFTNSPTHQSKTRLLPGDYIEMRIALSEPKPMLTVPLRAIRRDFEGKPFVWVVQRKAQTGKVTYTCTMHPEVVSDKPGKCPKCNMNLEPMEKTGDMVAHRVNVQLGGDDGQRVAILSGLQEGDEVIWAGHEELQEGTPVKPVPWGVAGPMELPKPTAPPTGHEGHEGKEMPGMQMERPLAEHKVGYTCSMHPEVVSDKPGDCPKCGMKLEPKR